MHQNPISVGALPQTPLGELTTLPDQLAGFQGPTSKRREGGKEKAKAGEAEGGEGKGRERKKREGNGKRRGREERGVLCNPKIP